MNDGADDGRMSATRSFAALVSATTAALICGCSSCPHPSDAQVMRIFQSHRAEFQRLVQMIETNRCIVRIDDDWTSPDAAELSRCGVSETRLEQYRKLLGAISVKRGFYNYSSSGEIWFVVSSLGAAVSGSGSSKNIVYRVSPPSSTASGTNDCECVPDEAGETLVPIEGNWYIGFRC
jgi:hypothetical protein